MASQQGKGRGALAIGGLAAVLASSCCLGPLVLVMLGISGGFVHGVGFDPYSRLWRTIFHPLGCWLLLGLGYLILWRAQG